MAGPLDLTPTNPGIVTSRAPQSSVSPDQVRAPYRELADNLTRIGEVTDKVAENAAEQAGYESEKVFARAFRRWSGLTPSAYLRRERERRSRVLDIQAREAGEA